MRSSVLIFVFFFISRRTRVERRARELVQVYEYFSNDSVREGVQNQIVAEEVNYILTQNTVRKQGSLSMTARPMFTLTIFSTYIARIP